MKISKINNLQFKNNIKRTKLKTSKNFYNYENKFNYVTYPKIYFTSKFNNSPSVNFIKTVSNEEQRIEVVESVLTDENGNYNSDNERLFLNTISKAKDYLDEEEIFYSDSYLPELVEASKIAFLVTKDEYKKPANNDYLALVATIAYIGILNRCSNIKDILEFCKNKDDIVNIKAVEAVIKVETEYGNNMQLNDTAEFINSFGLTDYEIDIAKLDEVIELFNTAQCATANECAFVYGIVADDNGNINEEKYNFAKSAFSELMDYARSQVGDKDGNIYPGFRYLVAKTIEAIIQRSFYKNGFNSTEALSTLFDWKDYVNKHENLLNDKVGVNVRLKKADSEEDKVISINNYISSNLPEPSMYDNNIYRLYALLNVSPISKEDSTQN